MSWMDILKAGQCYSLAVEYMFGGNEIPTSSTDDKLVHAEVTGQSGSSVEGTKYGHAFILKAPSFEEVYDVCQKVTLPKDFYYRMGNIQEGEPHEYIYTFNEMMEKLTEHMHYGPWDLQTTSGL